MENEKIYARILSILKYAIQKMLMIFENPRYKP